MGAVCCNDQTARAHELGAPSVPREDEYGDQADAKVNPPPSMDSQKAATKIQAKFRGNLTRQNIVVQQSRDPELQDMDVNSLTLQSKPNRETAK
mmetsp:Transcript_30864/g.71686  ORF Transcript_30864/g.71686 Transcript_30864/m.71686 type:complete len:94 (+) Transcript_30864:149-430(+)|eukprot:CAMPEP_0171089792 /NCGR_PEP_ID=MMETSP0766_2-20121228/27340_1 /TAXON_ID=439317 /ORGANISM="Gambierdiscus australes, Strain CAWD 149" /LENGTH=93 /DNA_ID=CAMNT_0011547703 /DNA_START=129 /DNA_END=410 /DNA_ORIENTATION=-